ncbi:hypothetical protein ACFXJ5_01820 [Streptomyces sp. NPDC059373]
MTQQHDHENDDAEQAVGGGGLFVGGSVTGGAIATGRESRATDSSKGTGGAPVADLPAPVAPPSAVPSGGAVVGGHVTGGAIAAGHGSEAVYDAQRADGSHEELLAAVTLLRQHLGLLTPGPEIDEVDGELAGVEDEITRTGRAEPTRLERLRERLTTGNAALAGLQSAVAVAVAIRGLLS